MESIHRLFLIVEGDCDAYPNYNNAKISFSLSDPALVKSTNSFVCSPIFPLFEDGIKNQPNLSNEAAITFLMVPSIFPSFSSILQEVDNNNQIWFSLGLANLIIIEEDGDKIANKVIAFLKQEGNIIAYEKWKIKNYKITSNSTRDIRILHEDSAITNIDITISEKLPLNLKFAVSEYILSVNKFLTASKRFTPHYYKNHLKTIKASNRFINDLSFLFGDDNFIPRNSLLNNLGAKNVNEARILLDSTEKSQVKEELINDRHGRIIQFNSSMSYIYSQAYAGTFPIFDHIGIIRRHSLLGVGTAISSLYELLIQLENSLYYLPFEELKRSDYFNTSCPNNFFEPIINPGYFDNSIWKNDVVSLKVISDEVSNDKKVPDDFYNRLSFFSGRLGFREYDFSATAAIQVLVESHCLKWHVINYTHEVIHNHVRLILDQIVLVPSSEREETYNNWIEKFRQDFLKIFKSHETRTDLTDVSYLDYFRLTIIKFVLNTSFYGSLSVPYDKNRLEGLMAEPTKTYQFLLPSSLDIRELLTHLNKDVTEIFVHVIDFSYIYKSDINIYLRSIWSSWSTIPAVSNDLKQYITRSLVIVGLTVKGKSTLRFGRVKAIFKDTVQQLLIQHPHEIILDRIIKILDNHNDEIDLRNRFYNCIIIGDLVYQFFVGRLDNCLENDDRNYLYTPVLEDDKEVVTYGIDTNSFSGNEIKSKVRFLLDQLIREINKDSINEPDDYVEKTSAWLLLSLSSQLRYV